MGKLINTALVFVGGMTAGGYCLAKVALKSETFTTALKDAIMKKTTEVLYVGEHPKRKVSYYDTLHSSKSVNRWLEQSDDIVFETREDAEKVLDAMEDTVKKYGVVSLADVYDIVGKTTTYVASKYGWKSVDDAKVIHCLDGYYIELPKAEEIK